MIPDDEKCPTTFYYVTLVCVNINEELRSADDVQRMYENTKWGATHVISLEAKTVEDYHDDHPLNKRDTFDAEIRKLFNLPDDPALADTPDTAEGVE